MQFRDLKMGDTIYIYDRCAISLNLEKVTNVAPPKLDKMNPAMGMVVDVSVANHTYTFKDATDTGFTGNLIISTDKTSILREVEAQKANNEAQISRVDTMREELPKLDSVIDLLSPEIREKKAQDERLNRLEDSINRLNSMIEQIALNGKNYGGKERNSKEV